MKSTTQHLAPLHLNLHHLAIEFGRCQHLLRRSSQSNQLHSLPWWLLHTVLLSSVNMIASTAVRHRWRRYAFVAKSSVLHAEKLFVRRRMRSPDSPIRSRPFVRHLSASSPSDKQEEDNHALGWLEQPRSPPNIITISRIACTPIISYWIVNNEFQKAVLGCLVAGITDGVDGYLAKHHGMATVLGSYLDPIADKVLINTVAISIWYSNPGLLPTPLMALWATKDSALLFFSYRIVREQWNNQIAKAPTPMMQVQPTGIAKLNTTLQFMTLCTAMLHPLVFPVGDPASWVLQGLWWSTGCTTLGSALSYAQKSGFAQVVAAPGKIQQSHAASTSDDEKKDSKQ